MPPSTGKLAVIKTRPTDTGVAGFLDSVEDEQKRDDSFILLEMMRRASGSEPVLWGSSIVGFGEKRYKSSATGREVDWFRIGFSPRKGNLSLYISIGNSEHKTLLPKLGKYKTGAGCLYIKRLTDVDLEVLDEMIHTAWRLKEDV